MKIYAKKDEEWCLLNVLSEKGEGEGPEKIAEPNVLGLG